MCDFLWMWNPLLDPTVWEPDRWAGEHAELRDASSLTAGLDVAKRIFSVEWAAEYGVPETELERSIWPTRLHPALADSRIRGNRWKLLLAGLAVARLGLSFGRVAAKLRLEPRRESGQLKTEYEDMLAELSTGLLVEQLGFLPEHEPRPRSTSSRKRPDWLGTAANTQLLFESKRRKRSEATLARMRAVTAFLMEMPGGAGGDHVHVRLAAGFDDLTRRRHIADEDVARQLARELAHELPPADGDEHQIRDFVWIRRTPGNGGVSCDPPPVANDEDVDGVVQAIDAASGQIKAFGLPGVVVVDPEESLLAVNYADWIAKHVETKGDHLAAVLLMLEAAPHRRFLAFPGRAWPLLEQFLEEASRWCACGARHVDLLTNATECEMAKALRWHPGGSCAPCLTAICASSKD